MDIELLEIRDFLAAHAPFDQLTNESLEQLPKLLTIRYLRRGQTFPPANEQAAVYLLRQGAIELRNNQGVLLEKLAEGELYTAACEENSGALRLHGVTSEDSLIYQLSCDQFRALCKEHPAFDAHFNASLRHRMQRVLQNLQQQPAQESTLLEVEVGQLINRAPVTAVPEISILEAARLMSQERLSSLLLVDTNKKLCGLITDRDLRSRCIAEQVDSKRPVSDIMTSELQTINSHTHAADALLMMNSNNVHHLPIVDGGKLVGIVSSSDLIRQQSTSAVHLVRRIHQAQDLDELVAASQRLPELQYQLVSSHASCYRIGQIVSSIGDALTQRLIQLAQQSLGEAPIPYAWLAVGSLARHELSVHSDQDNGLLLSDEYDERKHGAYFERLAKIVTDGLDACGIAYCPGDVMASNPQWRQPLKVWHEYFVDWVKTPDAKEVMLACNFFDLRAIEGDQSLFKQLFYPAVDMARHNQIFLAHLAANATRHTIPLGFFRQFVLISEGEHRDRLDLKRGGVMPITELARLFALSAGVTAVNTYDRLQQASSSPALSRDGANNLRDALELINTIRLRHQVQLHAKGLPMDNYINPEEISQVERQYLKDAFSEIRDMHSMLAQRYQTERFL